MFDGIYVSATRESTSGDVILKLVNIQATPQPLRIDIQGVQTIKREATGEMITGELGDINTVSDPINVIPKLLAIKDAGTNFSHELPAHSVSVLRLKTR
jgi:alpha-L-arabinofuranosidase